jgi:tetratricopeptide (TPR) repeat protein
LLTAAESKSEAGDYVVAFEDTKAALELAEKKKLVGDRAIAEEVAAAGYFALGKLDDSFSLYQASLRDASDSSSFALQADALVALSSWPQLQGNLPAALELLGKALERANQSKSLYMRARVLGELGRVQIASGQIEQGRKSVEEALAIDKVNGYDFEPLHSIYAAYASSSSTKPDVASVVAQLESARDLALEKTNYQALVLAENALGTTYVHTGDVRKGIATLEATLSGNILKNDQTIQVGDAFRSAVNLPFLKATTLEALGNGYDAAGESDEALESWKELYALSTDSGFTLTLAESATGIARIDESKKDVADALNYYGIAIRNWRIVKNYSQLSRDLVSEALLLVQSGKGEAAIPVETEAADIAEKNQDRVALFTAYGVLAEIYQPLDRFQDARNVLEKATALTKPGPTDSELDAKALIEDYTFLADDYKGLQLPIKELISLEKAISVLQTQKDAQRLQQLLDYTAGRFDVLKVEDAAAAALSENRLVDSLWY